MPGRARPLLRQCFPPALAQRLAWRTDSCEECRGPAGEDLSGGYYEAGGSYLKFSFPTAFTLTQLAWGVVEYRDGYEKVRGCCSDLSAKLSSTLVCPDASRRLHRQPGS